MNRLQKKCFLVSAGMHGALLGILLAGAAFRDKPPVNDMPILNMIPANIVDAAGAGGGSPEPATAAPPQAQPAPPQPAQPVVQPPPRPVVHEPTPEPVERVKPKEIVDEHAEPAPEPTPKKVVQKHHHEVEPDFTPANAVTSKNKKVKTQQMASAETSSSTSRESRRLQREFARALDALANGVKTSGAQGTVIDTPGQGGGEAFVGYETAIYNAYFHAWITPDSIANKLASADVKIVVSRDGTIMSAEIINKSGERALDASVERVLRAVDRLPPFPASAHDEQRSFLLRFNLEAKEGSG